MRKLLIRFLTNYLSVIISYSNFCDHSKKSLYCVMSLSKPKSNGNSSSPSPFPPSPLPTSDSPGLPSARRLKPPPFHVLSHVRYEHLIAGISGGLASTLVLHPLDLLKVRFAGEIQLFSLPCLRPNNLLL